MNTTIEATFTDKRNGKKKVFRAVHFAGLWWCWQGVFDNAGAVVKRWEEKVEWDGPPIFGGGAVGTLTVDGESFEVESQDIVPLIEKFLADRESRDEQ